MIRIVITQTTTEEYVDRVNFIVKSTPTQITENTGGYNPKNEVKCVEEYKTEDVKKTRSTSTELLEQNVADEDFDLKLVIKAINRL